MAFPPSILLSVITLCGRSRRPSACLTVYRCLPRNRIYRRVFLTLGLFRYFFSPSSSHISYASNAFLDDRQISPNALYTCFDEYFLDVRDLCVNINDDVFFHIGSKDFSRPLKDHYLFRHLPIVDPALPDGRSPLKMYSVVLATLLSFTNRRQPAKSYYTYLLTYTMCVCTHSVFDARVVVSS